MRLEEHTTLDAPTGEVWERVSDLPGYRRLLDGLSRWERVGEQATGSGARYLMRIHIGSADVGGLIEIVECEPQRDLAWTNVTGLDHRLRWRLRPREGGGTNVTLRFAYEAPGGLLSVVAERLAAREVSSHLRRTLANLRRLVEGDEAASEAEPGRGALAVAGDALAAARVLATAGVIRPERPERAARALARLARWGTTPAAGYAAAAARSPDAEAVVDERGAVRSGELHVRTNRIAHGLADLGVVEGDGVAIMCRNHRGFVEAIAALSKLGADALLLNTGFAGPQLVDVLKRERPRAVIYDEEFADLLGGALRGRLRIPAWTDVARPGEPTLEGLAAAGDGDEPVPPARTGRVTILTSGTTGTPKGASRSSPGIGAAISILSRIPLRAQEPTLVCAPLFHSWGFAHLNLSLLLQTKLVLQRRFEPEAVLAAIERERIGCAPMVPIMLQRILDLPEATRRRYDTSSLRVVPVSGSALSGDLAVRFMDEFGDVVYNLYGSTEVAWATIATPAELRSAPGTAGRPPRGTTVRIIDEHDAEVPHGEIGRIFVGNALLFEGYTGGGTKDSVDGLMATGDVGFIDDRGRLFVSGRDDDMIVSGGENVFPREVEDLLHRHPGVMDAAVIGVEDPEWGQRLKAFVVAGDGLTEDDVRTHVGENLARYKVPRDVELLDELPRNATGKVLKRELAERPEG